MIIFFSFFLLFIGSITNTSNKSTVKNKTFINTFILMFKRDSIWKLYQKLGSGATHLGY